MQILRYILLCLFQLVQKIQLFSDLLEKSAKINKIDGKKNTDNVYRKPLEIDLNRCESTFAGSRIYKVPSDTQDNPEDPRLLQAVARAVLTPCGDTTGPPVKMHFRALTIGTCEFCESHCFFFVENAA